MPNPDPKSKPHANNYSQIEEIFAQADALIENALRFAFLRKHHPPSIEDIERLKQRLRFHLLEDDYRRLRSYDQRAELVTWLQAVANRYVSRFLRDLARSKNLEDAPQELFTQRSTQEESLLTNEREKLLKEALCQLTPRERKLFESLRNGDNPEQVARELKIKVSSVYRRKHALIKKLHRLAEAKKKIVF